VQLALVVVLTSFCGQ